MLQASYPRDTPKHRTRVTLLGIFEANVEAGRLAAPHGLDSTASQLLLDTETKCRAALRQVW